MLCRYHDLTAAPLLIGRLIRQLLSKLMVHRVLYLSTVMESLVERNSAAEKVAQATEIITDLRGLNSKALLRF